MCSVNGPDINIHVTLRQSSDILLGLPAETLVTSLIDSLDLSNCDLVLIGESSEIVNDVCQEVSCYRTLLDNVKPFNSGKDMSINSK